MIKYKTYIYSSLKGKIHSENQDNILVIDEDHFSIFAVFDGVSSAKNGKKATIKAKQFVKENYFKYFDDKPDIKTLMFDLNQSLCNSDLKEPYSTYCLVFYDKLKEIYNYSWLGDSRLYFITNQFIELLTSDDSYIENILTKCLGDKNLNYNDFRQLARVKKGHLLLCTDGFYKLFENNRLSFFYNFRKKSLPSVKTGINSLIKGRNLDDSTFIFIK